MSQEWNPQQQAPPAELYPGQPNPGHPKPEPRPQFLRKLVNKAHALMRGRYRWAGLASVGGLILGAALGYLSTEPIYRSSGLLEVQPALPSVLHLTDKSEVMRLYEPLIERQLAVIRSREVIERALDSDAWQALGRGQTDADVESFINALEVAQPEGSRFQIEVAFTDSDPRAAAAAVQAVLDAYEQAFADRDRSEKSHKIRLIVQRQPELRQRLATINAQISQLTDPIGPVPIEQLYASKLSELNRIDSLLKATRAVLKTAQAKTATGGQAQPLADQLLAQLARVDPKFNDLLQQKQDIERTLTKLRRRLGGNAPRMVDLRSELRWTNQQIRRYVGTSEPLTGGAYRLGAGDASVSPLTVADLHKREDRLQPLHKQASTETAALAQTNAQVQALKAEADAISRQINEAQRRVEQLNTAGQLDARINVLDRGALPVAASRDARRLRAMFAGGAGVILGLGIVLLIAALDQRMLWPDNATLSDPFTPLLGTVPEIASDHLDPQDADLTALCIHEIRALLQIGAKTNDAKAFAITSPSKGAGKTSLTVGLASSLALSGTRTLLIDCDLAGRVLARQPATASRSGGKAQSPTTHSEREADWPMIDVYQDPADTSRVQSLDQVMLQMGYLTRNDEETFLAPHDTNAGMLSVLEGSPLEQGVIETNVPGLSILPALSTQANDIGRMSGKFIRRLIDEARSKYDIILFDTGPIPGSVEALFVTSEVDAVVLVVSQGEQQSRFDQTVSHLRMIGARLAGTVFNRAAMKNVSLQAASRGRRARTSKVQPLPSAATRAPRPQAALPTGSGILAAAVQAQAKPSIGSDVPGSSDVGQDADTSAAPDISPNAVTPQRGEAEDPGGDERAELVQELANAAVGQAHGEPALHAGQADDDPAGDELARRIQQMLDDAAVKAKSHS